MNLDFHNNFKVASLDFHIDHCILSSYFAITLEKKYNIRRLVLGNYCDGLILLYYHDDTTCLDYDCTICIKFSEFNSAHRSGRVVCESGSSIYARYCQETPAISQVLL